MKTHKKLHWIVGAIMIITVCSTLFTGCSMLNKITGKDQKQQSQQTEKIPKELQDIETAIETIFATLKGPALSQQEESQGEQGAQQQSTNGKDQQSGSNQSDKSTSSNQGGQSGQSGESSQTQQASDPFKTVDQEVSKLHYLWNEYMPAANKKGARKEVIASFSNNLNALTETLQSKDTLKIMLANNSVYAAIPDFYALYDTQVPPEIKRILYQTRSCILYAQKNEWAKVASNMEDLKSSWALLKNTLEKEQQEDAAKLDLSIVELEKVIKEKNPELIDIKGKIALTNIDALYKKLESAKKDKKTG